MSQVYHVPALLPQALQALDIQPDGVYVDATFGGGGHSRGIMQKLGSRGILVGVDQDIDATENIIDDERFIFVRGNFRYIKNFLRFHDIDKIDGLLADLGVSSHHFDTPERGFTFREDCLLDMRMNNKGGNDAAYLLNNAPEEDLARILKLYGELPMASKLARKIAEYRKSTPISTTAQLYEIASALVDPKREKKDIAKIFQALRIEVNDELGALKDLLKVSAEIIKPGGRLAIISYHSLEDRMIKNFMKTGNIEGVINADVFGRFEAPFKPLGSKPIVPDQQETDINPRARSAKMRVAVRQ